jgi:hypothetical protein
VAEPRARGVFEVLTELLGKVPDAATLELLLEPPHLSRLLEAFGWSEDAIRRDLTDGGRRPGELLLEVLEREPDTRRLLEILGNPAPRPKNKSAAPGDKGKSVAAIIVGAVVALPVAWYLFVRLDFLHAPGLAAYFPTVYVTLGGLLLAGLFLIGKGAVGLLRR